MTQKPSLFFYRRDCRLCLMAAEKVGAFYAEIGAPLIYRMITPEYYSLIPGLPALVIRKDVFNTDQEIILVGSEMEQHLRGIAKTKL